MPLLKKRTTMTANGFANPLQGDQYEYLPFPALVEFAVLVDAGGSVRATIFSGTDLLQQSALADVLAVATPISWPDHYSLSDIAGAGERINVELQETAAGTPIVRTNVRITPAA